jgi:hypothetical protein
MRQSEGFEMKVIFICGPYRAATDAEVSDNIGRAEKWAHEYWASGWAVICPHKNSAMMGGDMDEKIFLDGYLEILSRCNALLVMPGWERSAGARAEVEIAQRLGLEIIYGDCRLPLG